MATRRRVTSRSPTPPAAPLSQRTPPRPDLHSFPTRRSSDLGLSSRSTGSASTPARRPASTAPPPPPRSCPPLSSRQPSPPPPPPGRSPSPTRPPPPEPSEAQASSRSHSASRGSALEPLADRVTGCLLGELDV